MQVFGPLLPIVNVDNVDEAIEFINDRYETYMRVRDLNIVHVKHYYYYYIIIIIIIIIINFLLL